jgi:16S rRNA (guanine527-N7)-methyltransferase
MRQAVIDLALHNVNVVQQRVETLPAQTKYATVISRAFASLEDMINMAGHLCRPSGAILAMKGEYPTAELQALPAGFTLRAVIPLEIPGLEAQRHLVHIVAN